MVPGITNLQITNYKSLASVNIDLGSLVVLVGPNGSGKSNFIDVLSFVQECLAESVELAFKSRGGIGAVRRKSGGHPTHIRIRLGLQLDKSQWGYYAFEIAAGPRETFTIAREECLVQGLMSEAHQFKVKNGEFTTGIRGIRPKVSRDRLALFAASATEEFRPVFDFLTSIRVYSISPQKLRELQEPDSGQFLKRDGSNAAAVLKRLQDESNGGRYERVCRLLSQVAQGVERAEYHAVGQKESLQFKQAVGLKHPWTFESLNMSDGTLRVLGLLLAVYQPGQASVLAIEEPEATIHPAVAEVIMQVLSDASSDRQILVTTHSPDLLDSKSLPVESLRAVVNDSGSTIVAPVTDAAFSAVRERLYTPGELLRVNELEPDIEKARVNESALSIFGPPSDSSGVGDENRSDR